MKLSLKFKVEGRVQEVYQCFNKDLFLALNKGNAFPKATLVHYGDGKPGSEVKIELNFLLFKQLWISKITAEHQSPELCYFVDEGSTLPFFLKSWTHRHIVEYADPEHCYIAEEIEFEAKFPFADFMLYPAFKAQFQARGPIYENYFKSRASLNA